MSSPLSGTPSAAQGSRVAETTSGAPLSPSASNSNVSQQQQQQREAARPCQAGHVCDKCGACSGRPLAVAGEPQWAAECGQGPEEQQPTYVPMALFLAGMVAPPCMWVGSLWRCRARTEFDRMWGEANALGSFAFPLLYGLVYPLVAFIVCAAVVDSHRSNGAAV
eukprot:m51a1_g6163 hypothetical protein (165) ;mRNA; r:336851-337414